MEGGGLIPVENLSKVYFPSFPRVWNSSDRNPKDQTQTALFIGFTGSSGSGQKFWLECGPEVQA
jgi:hypothetical protein